MLRSSLLLLLPVVLMSGPPGATVSQSVAVPASMQTDVFSSPRSLTIPPGFQIAVWSRVPGARFMAIAPNGDVFVSQTSLGSITVLRSNGGSPAQFTYATGLSNPQGLAFDTLDGVTWLYVGQSDEIDRYVYNSGDTAASSSHQVVVSNLDGSGGHPLKDIAIGPDHTVYWGFGSACNVCATDAEVSPERGAVYAVNPDGSNLHVFASGLRNPEGLAIVPGTNTLWAAVNNRDDVPYPYNDANGRQGQVIPTYVDNHPPEPFTSVTEGADYGWPFCNATEDSPSGYNNMLFDNDQDTNADGHVDCAGMTRIVKGIQAHSAPLGLRFTQGTNVAAPYRTGAVIGYHGSWDRTVPTGYKVAYFPWSAVTQSPGDQIDLVTGFYGWGRPVDIAAQSDGSLLISDDASGTIYRMTWAPAAVSSASGFAIVAPGSYASMYGAGFAAQSLSLIDSNGAAHPAQMVYTSPSQINFIVPADITGNSAQLRLDGSGMGTVQLAPVAPGLFAAIIQTINGVQYLSIYGTGLRAAASGSVQVIANGVSLQVLYAGPQPTYPALDQINAVLPLSGTIEIEVIAAGVSSNMITVQN